MKRIEARLLAWYDQGARDLPWRRDRDPYRVWVSEVMLQQTRVEAVIPYYDAWMRRFPTLSALADAHQDDVLKAWEGLGYYSRARNLHRAVRLVRERHAGAVPADPASLKELPGVGDYTAGAIASIAFGVRAPAVDGNIRRALSRLYDLEDPSPADLRRLVLDVIPTDRPGDFNQALMELGARICTPRSPLCDVCPVATHCLARARGTQEERPRRRRAPVLPHHDVGTAVIVSHDGHLLLRRRPESGLLAGMWEFPGVEAASGESPESAATRVALQAIADVGGSAPAESLSDAQPIGAIEHVFSHRRITYHAFRVGGVRRTTAGSVEDGIVWLEPGDLSRLALPNAQRKIARLLLTSPERDRR